MLIQTNLFDASRVVCVNILPSFYNPAMREQILNELRSFRVLELMSGQTGTKILSSFKLSNLTTLKLKSGKQICFASGTGSQQCHWHISLAEK